MMQSQIYVDTDSIFITEGNNYLIVVKNWTT